MTGDGPRLGLLRGVGAAGIGAGALALFPSLAATVPATTVFLPRDDVEQVLLTDGGERWPT